MNILNIVSINELDIVSYEMLINDILIPIKEAILTYIIFDTIMGNENRKKDKFDNLPDKEIINRKSIKDNIITKFQLKSKRHKEKEKYTPYKFDEKKEYNIYSKIGKRYEREFKGKKNRENKDYPSFNKYIEWEMYFKNKFSKGASNDCNFKYYLNAKEKLILQKKCHTHED